MLIFSFKRVSDAFKFIRFKQDFYKESKIFSHQSVDTIEQTCVKFDLHKQNSSNDYFLYIWDKTFVTKIIRVVLIKPSNN